VIRQLIFFIALSLYSQLNLAAVLESSSPRTLMMADFIRWGGGLVLVLVVFFLCVWMARKAGGLSSATAGQMRVIGGLSLGAKERVVLMQLGEKQLLLGVSPGRVEALHTLEGEDCLRFDEPRSANVSESQFAQKLVQVMKGQKID